VRVDAIQLQQALLNLCINAMDAMSDTAPGRRHLELTTIGRDNGTVEIAVGDRGSGIRPEELPHLFDSFFTTKPHGMGLGLAITRSIVEAHGGTLRAENRADGGAIFRIVLPRGVAEAASRASTSDALAGRSAE
jgi:signal transduction histidine kinase